MFPAVYKNTILFSGESGKTLLAVAIGRRVLLLSEEPNADNEMGFEYMHIKVKF